MPPSISTRATGKRRNPRMTSLRVRSSSRLPNCPPPRPCAAHHPHWAVETPRRLCTPGEDSSRWAGTARRFGTCEVLTTAATERTPWEVRAGGWGIPSAPALPSPRAAEPHILRPGLHKTLARCLHAADSVVFLVPACPFRAARPASECLLLSPL